MAKLLSIHSIKKHFNISGSFFDTLQFSKGKIHRKKTFVHAINEVSLDIQQGETLSVVGESGCGKSTLARIIMGLQKPTQGEIFYKENRIDNLSNSGRFPYRRKMQMVFQNPYASLNPRICIQNTLEEPLYTCFPNLNRFEIKERVARIMQQVGISPLWGNRYPNEFSGGQRQRISIARALILEPEFIVADEPISALDVSIQAQILNLMIDLQEQYGLTYLFISHDLSVVEHISTKVAVMYIGFLCEFAPTEELFSNPQHPYTKALLSAIPKVGKFGFSHISLKGDLPTPINLPSGCAFHPRCQYANERCRVERPLAKAHNKPEHIVACHAVEEKRI
ncbi:MAG: ABC transporter ATP-binding protein [Desulfovibrionaceae bacterium]